MLYMVQFSELLRYNMILHGSAVQLRMKYDLEGFYMYSWEWIRFFTIVSTQYSSETMRFCTVLQYSSETMWFGTAPVLHVLFRERFCTVQQNSLEKMWCAQYYCTVIWYSSEEMRFLYSATCTAHLVILYNTTVQLRDNGICYTCSREHFYIL